MINIDSIALALPAIMEQVNELYLQNKNRKCWVWPDEAWFSHGHYDINMTNNEGLRLIKIYSYNHKLKRTNGTPILVINYDMYQYETLNIGLLK